ncbi:TlyA family RNA methyltransferase [Mesoterricola silvestris]|uniref:TlyA family rRNA (Cytidine-2'-O)-methyltransferase n=1 Tax=Mesoterricola silvestris TaxID=2927979 RepID=A0AA48GWT6_9BACT|nr:TlyA family RNA methyltransferase [Mesoterricola silvestris]BDU71788.1 TlyA family rRNA (cytidine-2'-O)-methyltransferase [Mesoterricola silvestris]
MAKVRLDLLLVQRGLCETRSKAAARIMAGDALVDDRPVTKAGALVGEEATLRLRGEALPFVSRGGLKLAHGLTAFGVDPAGRVGFDAGASTGGFTDCLLQAGAVRVYAVDVGTNQLHWKLRSDPRVVSMEQVNLRLWDPARIPEPCTILVADLSFISLRLAIPPILPSLAPGADAILLVKPQFEAGRDDVGAGGIVRDPEVHDRVRREIWDFFQGSGLEPMAWDVSPILGGEGNKEFLLHLRRAGEGD